jgi:hypothetical protein
MEGGEMRAQGGTGLVKSQGQMSRMSNARIGGIADEMFGASDLKAALAKLRRSVCKAVPN